MIAEAKYAFKATNKRLLAALLTLGMVVGMVPLNRAQADLMGSVVHAQAVYTDGAGNQQGIDVYQPGNGASHPGIIFVHGGGWRTGDKSQYTHLGDVAASRGYTAYSINYRLGPSGVYYQYEDVMRAIASIRQNAAQYGTDPNRIAVWGDSAGGSLAMRVAASGQTGLAAAVGWSAPVNAYTAIFNSLQSFAIGLDHSTCVPVGEITGILSDIPTSEGGQGTTGSPLTQDTAMTMLGSGNQGSAVGSLSQLVGAAAGAISSATGGQISASQVQDAANVASSLATSQGKSGTPSIYDPTSATATAEVKAAAAASPLAATATHTAVTQIPDAGQRAVLALTDALGCQDNFRVLSPALYFAKNTPPTFLVNAQDEYLVNPGQAIEYSNNLRAAGIDSSYLILPGANHMGYDERAVEPTFSFLDQHLRP
jgi:acetyl esterase/lipase